MIDIQMFIDWRLALTHPPSPLSWNNQPIIIWWSKTCQDLNVCVKTFISLCSFVENIFWYLVAAYNLFSFLSVFKN